MSRPISRFILPELPVDRKILQVMDVLCSISYAVGGARQAPEDITIARSKIVNTDAGQASPFRIVMNKEDHHVSDLHTVKVSRPKNSGKIEVPLWVDDSNCVSLILSHVCPDRRSQKGLRAAAEAYEIIRVHWRGDDEPELLARVKRNTIVQKAGRLARKADEFALHSFLHFYSDVELLCDPGKTMLDAWRSALGWTPKLLDFEEVIEDYAKQLNELESQFGIERTKELWASFIRMKERIRKEERESGSHALTWLEIWHNFSQMADKVLAAPKPSEKDMALLMREIGAQEELSLSRAERLPAKERKKLLRFWETHRNTTQSISRLSDLISTL